MQWGRHWTENATDKVVHGYIAEADSISYITAEQVATIKSSTRVNQQGLGYIRVNDTIVGVVFTSNNQEDLTLIESNGGWEHTACARQIKAGMEVFVVPNGPVFTTEKENAFGVRFVLKETAFKEKIKTTEIIEKADEILAKPQSSKKEQPRPYLYMASHVMHCVKDDMPVSHLGRIGGLADRYDDLILRGESLEAKDADETWREHMVPLKMVCNEASEMVRKGAPKADISQFMAEYVGLVIISKREQEYMDNTLKLKTRMPDGWQWGGDPYARFKTAGIALV